MEKENKIEEKKCFHEYKMSTDLGLFKICTKCGNYIIQQTINPKQK